MPKTVVLLSGGLDSTVNTALAVQEGGGILVAITCDYGQRSAAMEIASAQAICRYYSIEHKIVPIRWLGDLSVTPLTRLDIPIPLPEVEGFASSDQKVWIPNRNGVMLNIAAAYAEALGAERIITGFNAEEARSFPDNSMEFLVAANGAFRYSCRAKVQALSYTVRLDKRQIMLLAKRHDVPLQLSWWCYESGARACWRCGSCLRFRNAAEAARCIDWLSAKGIAPA